MSADLPVQVDAWRMLASHRSFEGRLRLDSLHRLMGLLADQGLAGTEVRYALRFTSLALGAGSCPVVEIEADAEFPLLCQRSLQVFRQPVSIRQRLGLIRHESEEAGLPPDVEPLMVPEDGQLRLADLIEDELILAVPVVPLNPEAAPVDADFGDAESADGPESPESAPKDNPFAALAALKQNKH